MVPGLIVQELSAGIPEQLRPTLPLKVALLSSVAVTTPCVSDNEAGVVADRVNAGTSAVTVTVTLVDAAAGLNWLSPE